MTKTIASIQHNPAIQKILLGWWQSMYLSAAELEKRNRQQAPSGAKAQLKRADTLEAAMLTEGFRHLWLALPEDLVNQPHHHDVEKWATIACTLVHVRVSAKQGIAAAAGQHKDNGQPCVSELRFAQLQHANNPNVLSRCLRRILQQVKGEVDIISLAIDIEQWFYEQAASNPQRGSRKIAVKWAMAYYQAGSQKAGSRQ